MWIVTFSGVLLLWLLFRLARVGRRESTLPPGPPTVPLLGNVNIFPKEFAFFKFTEWAREYGDLYSLKIGPDTTIVITSMKAVKELMEQQSSLTSNRPKSYMMDVTYEDHYAAMMNYNETWRLLRKSMHSILTPSGAVEHQPIQAAESTQLIYDLLHSPEELYTHIRRYSTSVITSIIFGKRFPQYDCPEVGGIFGALEVAAAVTEHGAHPPIDQLPFLNYIPERWASWKQQAKLCNKLLCRIYFHLLSLCEERIQRGEENGCFLEGVIENQEKYGLTRKMIGYLGGVLLDGGAHTTSAFLQSMILCLMAFPEAQKRAHEELDRVVGEGRAPRLDDFDNLPYCQALINEIHRFRPVAPLGMPHATSKEVRYRNYVLPRGTVVFVNIWGIYHDPDVYEDPETFNPGRYLQNEFGTKPGVDVSDFRNNIVFGNGRRMCPGMHLANTSLALNVMNLLWAFEFSPAIDPRTGEHIPVGLFNYEKGSFYAPAPFSCTIKPRSSARTQIIETEYAAARTVFEKFESREVAQTPTVGATELNAGMFT
ncbi:cytochrome P450 [Dendrothele bispora CBS 962.96]|uniref:Cytochrome P450 n=1 Tax=Dendrothele bispora (strain CBS 962.96) TaxID=1314807 RepID=A0A4S8MER0_DENBC|nr:cytochrome P450 [Dendrothele bispora CBS 962.96]